MVSPAGVVGGWMWTVAMNAGHGCNEIEDFVRDRCAITKLCVREAKASKKRERGVLTTLSTDGCGRTLYDAGRRMVVWRRSDDRP